MNNSFNFSNIKQYDNYVINITKKDYEKLQDCISLLTKKYNDKILNLHQIEKNNMNEFDFYNQRKFVMEHKRLLIDIIKEVLNIYCDELNNLEVVFLSGSFARGTNKMSSDVDLHFFL